MIETKFIINLSISCLLFLNGFSQMTIIDNNLIKKIIDNDSTYLLSNDYQNTIFCIDCNTETFEYKDLIAKSFNKEEVIRELKKQKTQDFLVIRIGSALISPKKVKLNYSVGLVNYPYYNKKMQLIAILDLDERQLIIPSESGF